MMRSRIFHAQALRILFFVGVGSLAGAASLYAKDLPSDPCTLLPPAQITKVVGEVFAAPQKIPAPAPFANNPIGFQCAYTAAKGPDQVLFIIYMDPSTSIAKDTFEKLTRYYGATSTVSGLGDTAYVDSKHAIHVLSGKVRYFISLSTNNDKQVKEMAEWVIGQL